MPSAASTTTVQRGYGGKHVALRRRWAPRVERGGVCCARCGYPIMPGSEWDLGHDDVDRSRWTGPEHAVCNRGAPSRRRGKRATPKRYVNGRW